MSQIFDALQRSEAESSGMDISALAEATELLQQAERRAASHWKGTAVREREEATPAADAGISLGSRLEAFAAATLSPNPTDEHLRISETGDVFAQIKSFEASISPRSRVVCVTNAESPAAEAFRLLGVRLRNLRRERPLKKLLVTSTIPQEGKSMVAANLASTLAFAAKEKILLLEGDVRRPSLSETFGMSSERGLCEYLKDGKSPISSIYRLEGIGHWMLPAGTASGNPLELLQSKRLAGLMDQLTGWFDWIVIDTPPVLPLADTSVWARLADGILLVTRQGVTEKRQLQKGLDAIEPKKVIGALLNSCASAETEYYYYRKTPASAPPESNPE
jgi:capsular exopolysaccharide synthesis family protein